MTQPLPPVPEDDGDRRVAVTDFERNIVVEAGAGTGKTSLLVERALNAIATDVATIVSLAAITFTDKAAGELRQRLAAGLERLRALARGERPGGTEGEADRAYRHLTGEAGIDPEQVAARALGALEQLDLARVTTIHGFCSELLRDYPVQAGVEPGFSVDSGEHAATLARAGWESFVARELGPEAPRSELWIDLLARVPLAEIAEVAHGLAGFSVPRSALESPYATPSARELFGARARELVAEMKPLLATDSGVTSTARNFFESASAALEALSGEGLEGLQRTVEADAKLRHRLGTSALPPNKLLRAVSGDEFKRVFREARELLRDLCHLDETLMPRLLEAVAPFAREFRESVLRQGQIGFDALLVLARDLLRDHPDVREELKRRFRLLLVDEFQDTDPVQYEIVLLLAEKAGQAAPEAYEALLEPGRLFVVGDPKQSIYRFRGADYGAFRRAVDYIGSQGGHRLQLRTNFRSVAGVTRPVNDIFEASGSIWRSSDYQPEYTPVQAARGPSDGPAVELWTFDLPHRVLAEERREIEGQVIAREIEQRVGSGACDYSDITILFRAFAPIALYLRSLRRRGIPFVVDGGKEFLERPEVSQMIATLRTLTRPADATALLAFLRSPAGGISDTALKRFVDDGGRWDWRVPVPGEAHREIATRFELLESIAQETRDLPADAVVRRVVDRAHLLPLGAAGFEGAQRVANLRKLVLAAGELAGDGRLSLDELVEALQKGRIANLETDPPLTDDASRAVRITSIHRMKGLENRWVILADLARGERVRGTGARTSGVAPVSLPGGTLSLAVTAAGRQNPAALWLAREHERHERAEEVRVLYVALTRARDRLVLVAGPARTRSSWIRALVPWKFDPERVPEDGATLCDGEVLHRRMSPGPRGHPAVSSGAEGADEAVKRYRVAVEACTTAARAPFKAPSADHAAFDETQDPDVGSPLRRGLRSDLGRAVGIAVHRLLAAWPDDPNATTGRIATTIRSIAMETGVDEAALASEVRGILEPFTRSPLGRLARDGEVIGREVPILLRGEDGVVYRGSIDLLYRGRDGQWVVADYKTDHENDDDTLLQRYGSQLRTYARAVQQAGGLLWPPRAEIWLLRAGRSIGVPHG